MVTGYATKRNAFILIRVHSLLISFYFIELFKISNQLQKYAPGSFFHPLHRFLLSPLTGFHYIGYNRLFFT